jgi:hypothetical protein
MTDMTDIHEFLGNLAQYTGTEHYYRHALNRNVTFTDGVKYFAETAGAFWLLDIYATELDKLARKHGIIFATATAKDGKATLSAARDSGRKPLWTRDIDFTTLPDGEWPIWIAEGGPENTVVLMLPSEY